MMSINMDAIKETFFQECDEHIARMEGLILKLEESSGDAEVLNSIFRLAHSIKGNSGTLGFNVIYEFTHTLESVLERLRSNNLQFTKDLADILLQSVDCLKEMLSSAKAGSEKHCSAADKIAARLKGYIAQPETAKRSDSVWSEDNPGQENVFEIMFEPSLNLMMRGLDPVIILRALKSAGTVLSVQAIDDGLPLLHEIDPEKCYLKWKVAIITREKRKSLESIFDFVRHDSTITITDLSKDTPEQKLVGSILLKDGAVTREQLESGLKKQKKIGEILVEEGVAPDKVAVAVKKQEAIKKVDAPTIRVDVEKVDKLLNLVGELVITQSMISQIAAHEDAQDMLFLQKAAAQLERNTREIQERVMGIRMLPIATVFDRFARVVRDVCQRNGKKANLSISGEETELDRTVIEKITDPLTHLIRNAVDHGLELPEERVKEGKTEVGSIKLNAWHEGGYVVVSAEDDGRGLDREKLIKKAVDKGLVEPQNAGNLSDSHVYNFIFQPGFSTADKVTDVSGRGVGMDVVKRNIEGLGGSVSIDTKKGLYTKMILRIPLTLAIIDGLTINVGDETYILPINSILESKRPARDEVKTIAGEGEVVKFRGNYIPLIRLYRLFDVPPQCRNPWESLVVVVGANGSRYALMVDELTGQQQVVIKNMGDGFRNLPGIAGATIMGDGKVSLILDIDGVARGYQTKQITGNGGAYAQKQIVGRVR